MPYKGKIWVEGSDVELEMPGPAQVNVIDRPYTRFPTVIDWVHKYHKELDEMKKRRKKKQEEMEEGELRLAQAEANKKKRKRERKAAERQAREREKQEAREARLAARHAKLDARAAKLAKSAVTVASDDEHTSETEPSNLAPARGPQVRDRRPAKRRRTGPFVDDTDNDADDETETAAQHEPPAPATPLPGFLRLPLEIREIIYMLLLVPDAESKIRVQVCNGWTETLKGRANRRLNSRVHTAIMRVNSQIADECVRVLYGNNEFEYCLRDANITASGDSDEADDDHVEDDEEDEYLEQDADSDDDYEEPRPRAAKRPSRTTAGQSPTRRSTATAATRRQTTLPYDTFDPDVQINVRKFGHHFRRIRIKAEPGRSSPPYRAAMAQAIQAFCDLQPLRARLHTLTIEIRPQRDPRDETVVTFVDFFAADGEVIAALRRLPTQFIRIVVRTDLRNEKTGLDQTEILLDLRPAASMRRAFRGERDMWAGDVVAIDGRRRAATHAQRVMLSLPKLIEHQWEQQEVWLDELGNHLERDDYEVELAEAEDHDDFWG